MTVVYRMHSKGDEEALIRLWSEHGGWDRIDAETWCHRLLRPPLGEAAIAIAEDDTTGAICGQFAFIPSLLSVEGREVTALRPFAPIVTRELSAATRSFNPMNHPVPRMYSHAVDVLRARGVGLIYMVPDPRWQRLFRLTPYLKSGSFPLWSKPLPLEQHFALPSSTTVTRLEAFDERVDRLWQHASRLHGCSVVRDSRTLPWKIGSGDYEVLGIEQSKELVGLVASRAKGDRQWLVCDLLSFDTGDVLCATLAAVCNLAHSRALEAPTDRPITKISMLVTTPMEQAAHTLGFRRDNYDFPLVVHVLDPTLDKSRIDPSQWYLSPND
jgi:hypothetical protein